MSEYIPACQQEGNEFDFGLKVIDVNEVTGDVLCKPADTRCADCVFIEHCTQSAVLAIYGNEGEEIENTYVGEGGVPVALS